MQAVTYLSVLWDTATALGLNVPRDLSNAWGQKLTSYLNRRLEKAWKHDFWPEWTRTEQRTYRPAYNAATAYAAPTPGAPSEVFDPQSVSYFQALQATTGQPPTVNVNGSYQVNAPYWSIAAQGYGSVPVSAFAGYPLLPPPPGFTLPDWQANTAYTGGTVGHPGTQVRNPADNQAYECLVSHTSGAAFDATKFGLLTPFDKYIALDQAGQTLMGEVKRVCRRDPYVYPKTPGELAFRLSDRGVQLKQDAPAVVWVEFRLRPPVYSSNAWGAGTAYSAGQVIYSTTDGNGYLALAGSTNVNPVGDLTGKWQVLPFPLVIASAVKRLVLADAYRDQKQSDRAADEEEHGREELQDAWDIAAASQGQYETAQAWVYGS